jgi:hypothetical protein
VKLFSYNSKPLSPLEIAPYIIEEATIVGALIDEEENKLL